MPDDRRVVSRTFPSVITLPVILEHLSPKEQPQVTSSCYANLTPEGVVIVIAPAPCVDHLLSLLRGLRVVEGIYLDDHHGWDARKTPELI